MGMHENGQEGTPTDYDRVGGGAAVRSVVDRFSELVLDDERLAAFFNGTDMQRLKRHQVLLVSQVLGGPANYDGRELREAHAGMDISREHFGLVVGYLAQSLSEAGVDRDIIDRVGDTLAATQDDVVAAATH
jgi:hemoglobin